MNPIAPDEIAASSLASARLAGDDSLAVFRVLLESASRPGTPVALAGHLSSTLSAPLLAVLALMDLDHRFVVLGDDESGIDRWTPLIAAATDAQRAPAIGDADVVIARRSPTPEEIAAMRTGTAETPESGARLFVACRSVTGADSDSTTVRSGSTRFSVTGPGAPEPRGVDVVGIDDELPTAVAAASRSFPAGIDVWFVDDTGTVIAVPRSSLIDDGEVG